MNRWQRIVWGVVLGGGVGLLLGTLTACQSQQRQQSGPATQSSSSSEPTDVMAQSDADRAKAAIDRNQREQSGARQPRDHDRRRVVDQPSVGGRR